MATRAKPVTGAKVESVDAVARDLGKCAAWCAEILTRASADAETIAALQAAASMLALASERVAGDVAIVATARAMADRYYGETVEARDDRERALADRTTAIAERDYARGERDAAIEQRDRAIGERNAAHAEIARASLRAVEPASDACPNMARVEALRDACEADGRVRVTSAVVYPTGHTIVEIAWQERVTREYGTDRIASGKPRYDFNAHTGDPETKGAPRGMAAVVREMVAALDGGADLAVAS